MKETLKLEDLLPLLDETLKCGGEFSFFPRGTSMLPMIRQGIDSVKLVSPEKKEPKKGDVILYRRKSGDFVLHRIHSVKNNGEKFSLCGDNQEKLEKNVPLNSVIGVMIGYSRDNEWIPCDDPKYLKYVKKRILIRPFRKYLRCIKKIFALEVNK